MSNIVKLLADANVIEHYMNDVYYDGGYITCDVTLTTNIGKFNIKGLLLYDAVYPDDKLLASHRPGFSSVLKEMIIERYYYDPESFEITYQQQ
jgi:hypothetical protein